MARVIWAETSGSVTPTDLQSALLPDAIASIATKVNRQVLRHPLEQFDVDAAFQGTTTATSGPQSWSRNGQRDPTVQVRIRSRLFILPAPTACLSLITRKLLTLHVIWQGNNDS